MRFRSLKFAAKVVMTLSMVAAVMTNVRLHDVLKSSKDDSINEVVQVTDNEDLSVLSVKVGDAFADAAHLDCIVGVDAKSLLNDGLIFV